MYTLEPQNFYKDLITDEKFSTRSQLITRQINRTFFTITRLFVRFIFMLSPSPIIDRTVVSGTT